MFFVLILLCLKLLDGGMLFAQSDRFYLSAGIAGELNYGKRPKDGLIERFLSTPAGVEKFELVTKKNTYWFSFLNNPVFRFRRGNTGYRVCNHVGLGYGAQVLVNYDFSDLGIATGILYNRSVRKQYYFFDNSTAFIDFSEVNEINYIGIPIIFKVPVEENGGFDTQSYSYIGIRYNYNIGLTQYQFVDANRHVQKMTRTSDAFKGSNITFLLGYNVANSNFELALMPGHFLDGDYVDEYGLRPYANQRNGLKLYLRYGLNYTLNPVANERIAAIRQEARLETEESWLTSLTYSVHTFFNFNYAKGACNSIFTTLPFVNSSLDFKRIDQGGYGYGIGLEHSNFGIDTQRNEILNKNSIFSVGPSAKLIYRNISIGGIYYWNYYIRRRQSLVFSDDSFQKFFSVQSREIRPFTADFFLGYSFPGTAITLELHYMPENILDQFYTDRSNFQPHEFADNSIVFFKLKRDLIPLFSSSDY